ncbi:KilA-N domain-containing protein [Rhizobium oryzihabitans]|uniref:KilA-N domain-containing protein n=1 Tax=Rhizobium oryzihabitans TaxID=2267833 RepID=A0A7L5BH62_9HYPH|nr:KilA-N domain-containing protein [Rhizobium oryzihabitans]QIB38155.1 KilA-N domain-containing protein [Rhizobium oryzihabitans]
MNAQTPSPLSYNGHKIADKGDDLCLTDMWKACGSPANKEPFNWVRFDGRNFIAAVGLAHNLSHTQVIKTKKGKGGATFAHWQAGMAYAQYLDHDFHMWCNTAAREKMEGKVASGIPADVLELIRRTDGIAKMLAHKVTEIEKAMPLIAGQMAETLITAKLAERNLLLRHGVTAKRIWDDFNLTPRLRGSTVWFGNRLAEMGCCIDGGLKADRGNSAVRLFDPDKARICMKNGLLNTALSYAAERQGQGKLNLKG